MARASYGLRADTCTSDPIRRAYTALRLRHSSVDTVTAVLGETLLHVVAVMPIVRLC